MGFLVVKCTSVLDVAIRIDHEWCVQLVTTDNLVFANLTILGATIMIGGLDLNDRIDNSALVHRDSVRVLAKRGRKFIHILYRYMNSGAERKKMKSDYSDSSNSRSNIAYLSEYWPVQAMARITK